MENSKYKQKIISNWYKGVPHMIFITNSSILFLVLYYYSLYEGGVITILQVMNFHYIGLYILYTLEIII